LSREVAGWVASPMLSRNVRAAPSYLLRCDSCQLLLGSMRREREIYTLRWSSSPCMRSRVPWKVGVMVAESTVRRVTMGELESVALGMRCRRELTRDGGDRGGDGRGESRACLNDSSKAERYRRGVHILRECWEVWRERERVEEREDSHSCVPHFTSGSHPNLRPPPSRYFSRSYAPRYYIA
jgi:hypothetical protein